MSALKEVMDPEIHQSIVDLNMVKKLDVKGDNVFVEVALTVPGCPLAHTIKSDVKKAAMGVKGVKSVDVETTSMSKEELAELQVKLQNRVMEQRKAQGKTSPVNTPGINRLERGGIRNVIAIVSGKGGVGKSFVTGFLAVQLRRLGYEVGILDADITGPSIAKILGLKPPLVVGPDRKLMPGVTKTGIKVVSMNLVLEEASTPVIVRGPIVNSVIRQLYSDVVWGDLHFLLVDLPPGTSDAPLTVFQSLPLDGVVMVTTPQDLAVMIVGKAINMARTLSEQIAPVKILGLIENMSYAVCPKCGDRHEIFGQSKGAKAAKEAGLPFLGAVPLDAKIASLCDQGRLEDYDNQEFAEVTEAVRIVASKELELVQATPIAWAQQK